MSVSLIFLPAFQCEKNMSYCVLPSLYIFLSAKTSVATSLNLFNSVDNFLAYFYFQM